MGKEHLDCKKSTLAKSQRSKSTLVNGLVNVLVNDDVAVTSANDVAMMTSLGLTSARGPWRVEARVGSRRCVEARGAREILCRIFWRRVRARGSSDDG